MVDYILFTAVLESQRAATAVQPVGQTMPMHVGSQLILLLLIFVAGCESAAPPRNATDSPNTQPGASESAGTVTHWISGIGVSPDGRYLSVVSISRPRDSLTAVEIVDVDSLISIVDVSAKNLVVTRRFPGQLVEAWYGVGWSPDGRWLATSLYKGEDELWSIYRVNAPKWESSKVSDLKDHILQRPLVSPTGSAVLCRASPQGDLFIHHLGANGPSTVTACGDVSRLAFDWMPDGTQIYFGRGHFSDNSGIWTILPDGKDMRMVNGSEQYYARTLRISPSGKWLAFVNRDATLWISTIADFAPTQVSTQNIAGEFILSWSPTREVLAYAEHRNGDESACLQIWSADGTMRLQNRIVSEFPVWLGDDALAFKRNNTEVWKYEFKSGKEEKLFDLAGNTSKTLDE